tara:strand:- start:6661 stop:7380 length:720 start_codon:yes stop_codon:yes gene_type:complete
MIDLSIIIINKNYLRYLKKCINSCFDQKTQYSYEIIVIDDGSIDGSINYIQSLEDKRLKFFQSNCAGIEKASNIGFKKSKGKYVVRVDSDDLLRNNFIEKTIREIKKSRYDFVYSNYFEINSMHKLIKKKKLPIFNKNEIRKRGDFLATGTVYKKKLIKSFDFYNEKFKNCGLENYELVLKLLNQNCRAKRINNFLFYYRHHQKNISIIRQKKIINYGKKLFYKMNLGKYSKNKNHPWI